MENHYNLKNYRLENKKLPVGLPGEKKAKFYEKSFVEREAIDNKKLDKFVKDNYGKDGELHDALKKTYKDAERLLKANKQGESKVTVKRDSVKEILLKTAYEQNAESVRLKNTLDAFEMSPFGPKHAERNSNV